MQEARRLASDLLIFEGMQEQTSLPTKQQHCPDAAIAARKCKTCRHERDLLQYTPEATAGGMHAFHAQ
jgi:hypothetical protein